MSLDVLSDLPDSAVAKELESGRKGRFSDRLETLYLQQHLRFARTRVRLWFTLTSILTVTFSALRWSSIVHGGAWLWLHTAVHVGTVLALAWLAWSRLYFRLYLPTARLLAPVYLCCATIAIAVSMRFGKPEELANLAVIVFANYFLGGLLTRGAIFASATMVVTFGVTGWLVGMEPRLLYKGLIMLSITFALGAILMRDMELNRRRRFLEKALIGELVERDPLSGLKNRRAFDQHIKRVWHDALRDGEPVSLLLVDIDHFKNYNDLHGHQAGDVALRAVAQVLREFARRPLDMAARYGGEEFALILFATTIDEAQQIAERARQAVAAKAVHELKPMGNGSVTISIGIAHVMPAASRTPAGVVQMADEALYEAKAGGRNCAVFKGDEAYDLVRTGSFRTLTQLAS